MSGQRRPIENRRPQSHVRHAPVPAGSRLPPAVVFQLGLGPHVRVPIQRRTESRPGRPPASTSLPRPLGRFPPPRGRLSRGRSSAVLRGGPMSPDRSGDELAPGPSPPPAESRPHFLVLMGGKGVWPGAPSISATLRNGHSAPFFKRRGTRHFLYSCLRLRGEERILNAGNATHAVRLHQSLHRKLRGLEDIRQTGGRRSEFC